MKSAPARTVAEQEDRGRGSSLDVAKAITFDDYRKNAAKRMLSDVVADRWRWECLQQPNWRRDMQLDEDYYDGNQLSSEVMSDLEDRGIPPVVTNLIGPTIDLVLGMEAKTRRDFVVKPEDDPQWDDAAMAMSAKLKTAERLSMADNACSQAYKRQVKGGLGWVYVGRESDPFKYRYRCEHVDWKEIDYDPYAQRDDLDDARFLRRCKFHDRDILEALFPHKAADIHELGPGFRDTGAWSSTQEMFEAPMLRGASHGPWRDYSMTQLEYVDWDRNRLLLEEFWYRVWVRGEVIGLPDGTSVVYDRNSEFHNFALNTGRVQLRPAAWAEMRQAYFIGPLCLSDVPSPHPFRGFPYVAFWGMREGRTGVPYGLIRRMRPMQDEVNARSSKMLWALSARRVIADPGALLDHERTRLEVARPDAYILLNPKRQPHERFDVEDNGAIAEQQFQVLQDRIQRLQDVGGVYQSMLGKRDTGADSGIAIQSLVEQGTTTLAPINEGFVGARSQVGDRLLAYVIADMSGMRDVPVQVNSARGKRVIVLNQASVHEPSGIEIVQNNIAKARLKVSLDDVPATATFRQQQFMRIADMVGNMAKFNPELASKFMDLLVEASDVPNKADFVERVREFSGITPDPSTMTPEQLATFQRQQEEAAKQREVALRAALAKIGLDESRIAQINAQAQKVGADTQGAVIGFDKLLAEIQLIRTQIAGMQQDQAAQATALAANGGRPDKQEAVYRW